MNRIIHFIKNYPGFIIITLIFITTIVYMLPFRNVAFEDDFAYIQTAEHLYKTGELKISEWSATSLIFQTYWGVLFAKIFGFSIKILILSNVILLYFALIAFYFLLKRLLQDEKRALLFTTFLIGIPWILNYAFSFMSDVFYMSLMVISCAFFVIGFSQSSKSLKWAIVLFLLGSTFAGFAFLNRQLGALITLSAVITVLYRSIVYKKFDWQYYLAILLPTGVMVIWYQSWLNQTGMTVWQNLYFGEKAKQNLMISIWPARAEFTYISQQFYLECIQRFLGFFSQSMGFLFPLILIFSFKFFEILAIIKNSLKLIALFLILIVSLFLIDSFIPDLNHRLRYTQSPAQDILYTDSIFGYLAWWPKIILISIPIWSIMLAVTYKKIVGSFVVQKEKMHKKIFFTCVALLTIVCFHHFYLIFQKTIATKPHFVTRLTTSTVIVFAENQDILPTINEIFASTWLFFLVFITAGVLINVLFTHFKIKFNSQINFPIMFIALVLILQLIFTIVGGYFYWHNYIIQFLPLLIIYFAYFFRNVKIDYRRALLVSALLLLFSLETTRNRYQPQGAKWELGTELIKNGANITSITTVNWAWRPYWLFEENLENAIKEAGGDKYKIGQKIGGWFNGYAPGSIVDILEIDPSQLSRLKEKEKILSISDPYWTFKGQYIVVAVERE